MSFTIAEQSNLRFMAARGEKKERKENGSCSQRMIKEWRVVYLDLFKSDSVCHLSSFLTQPIQETRRTNESYFHGWLSRMFREYFPPAAFALPEFRRVENLGN